MDIIFHQALELWFFTGFGPFQTNIIVGCHAIYQLVSFGVTEKIIKN